MTERTRYVTGTPSRIGWGAVFAGVFVAFAVLVILNAFGVAIGLSGAGTLGLGTGIWAAIAAIISLFLGGWVMTRSEVITSRSDAIMHGVVLWGILFFGISVLAVSGLQMGLSLVTGAINSVSEQFSMAELADMAARMGLSPEQVQGLQEELQARASSIARGAWWSLLALLLSLCAVVAGAITGAGVRRKHTPPAAEEEVRMSA